MHKLKFSFAAVSLLAGLSVAHAGDPVRTQPQPVVSAPTLRTTTHMETRTQTVQERVPVTKSKMVTETVMVPKQVRKRVQYTEYQTRSKQVQVQVPVQRTVATRQVPVTTMQTRTRTVMVPKQVTEQVPVTSYRTETYEVPTPQTQAAPAVQSGGYGLTRPRFRLFRR